MDSTKLQAPPRTIEEVTIASVPSGHVYVRHLAPLVGPAPRRLPDSDRAQRVDVDLFHLHFGFDDSSPEQLADLTELLRRRRVPLVFTVHDLRNPHHLDRRLHDEQLDVLVPASDAIITLTRGAADEIERRWQRTAVVLPHPHVVDLQTMAVALGVRPRRRRRPFRVGLHLKSLRASMAPMRILPTLVDTVAGLGGAVLQVDGHRDVLEPGGARYDAELTAYLRSEQARGRLELHVHDYFTDGELWAYLASLDVSVLPYRFGTHSGWLEACRDLQTTVVAPTCGYFTHQGPVLAYTHDENIFDPDSLCDAVTHAFIDRPRLGATIDERTEQRRRLARAHQDLYLSLLADRRDAPR